MGLVDLLKSKRNKVVELNNQSNKEIKPQSNEMDNITIIIENSNGAFENEEDIIKEAAVRFYEVGQADSYENAIIQAATIIRGLQYKETTKDENGNLVITFRDLTDTKKL